MVSIGSFDRGDNFDFDRDRRRERVDLDRRACGVGFAGSGGSGEVLGIHGVVGSEIVFHVR